MIVLINKRHSNEIIAVDAIQIVDRLAGSIIDRRDSVDLVALFDGIGSGQAIHRAMRFVDQFVYI